MAPLRESRSFRLLWIGQLISLSGSQLRLVALPYQIFLLTGSSFAVGLIGVFQAVPLLVLSLFGGVIADAVDRRRLLLVTQVGLAAVSFALAVATGAGAASVPLLYVLTAIGACFSALDNPTRASLAPTLVERRLIRAAMALNQTIFQFALVFGSVLAGIVIARFGLAGAYWLDVASFAAAFVAVWMLRAPPRAASTRQPVLHALVEGIRYLGSRGSCSRRCRWTSSRRSSARPARCSRTTRSASSTSGLRASDSSTRRWAPARSWLRSPQAGPLA
jgi:MFS family permease